MKCKYVFLTAITLVCGCRYAEVPCLVHIGSIKVPAIAVTFPYELDYHKDIGWLGKSPWNHELIMSDKGIVFPFGSACALMPVRPINCEVEIKVSYSGYKLMWHGNRRNGKGDPILTYISRENSRPAAYKLTINEDNGDFFRCEPIPLEEAITQDTRIDEQYIVFAKDGVLIKRLNEDRFSYIRRPMRTIKPRKNCRKVVLTKADKELLDYIDSHADELMRLWERW